MQSRSQKDGVEMERGSGSLKVKRSGADWNSGDGGVAVVAVGYKQAERVRVREWEKTVSEKVTDGKVSWTK